ncbi:MAG: hypothetical protein LBI70_01580 [Rickettsiales bacterium]|jgi:hypothetical protein|nr:hypothetical protein [Rickettsiales bacterium]
MEGDIFEIVGGELKKKDSFTEEERNYLFKKGFIQYDGSDSPATKKFIAESVRSLQRELPKEIDDLPITFLDSGKIAKDVADAPVGIILLENTHCTMFIKNKIGTRTEIFVIDPTFNEIDKRIIDAYESRDDCTVIYPATARSIKNEEEWTKALESEEKECNETLEKFNKTKESYSVDTLKRLEKAFKVRSNEEALEKLRLTPEEQKAFKEYKPLRQEANQAKLQLTVHSTVGTYYSQEGNYFIDEYDGNKSKHDLGIQQSKNNCSFFALEFTKEICKRVKEKKNKENGSFSTLQALQAVTDGFEKRGDKKQGSKNFIMPNFLMELSESKTALDLTIEWQKKNNKTDFVSPAMILAFKKEREKRLGDRLDELGKELEEFRNSLKTEKGKTEEEKEKEISKKQEENKKKLEKERESLISKISIGNNLRNKKLKESYTQAKYQETLPGHLNAALRKMEANKKVAASTSNNNLAIETFAKVKNTGENISSSNTSLPNKVANQEKSSSLT